MKNVSFRQTINSEVKELFRLKKTERVWHIPLLAALCIGLPLLAGLYFNNLQNGLFASLSGIVILYLPVSATVPDRMMTLLACSFGFMVSFTIGIIFSFDRLISSIVFGFFSMIVHWIVLYFKIRAPGSFFFIMIASIASCFPFNLSKAPERIGLIGLGTMTACIFALIYSLLVSNTSSKKATNSSVL